MRSYIEHMKPLVTLTGRLNRVVVDAGGGTCVTCSDDATARVWDLDMGICTATLQVGRTSRSHPAWTVQILVESCTSAACPLLHLTSPATWEGSTGICVAL